MLPRSPILLRLWVSLIWVVFFFFRFIKKVFSLITDLAKAAAQKHVLLTGACGFVGQILLPMMLDKGYRVTCISSGSDFLDTKCGEWMTLDINDAEAVSNAIQELQPSHVVHLAAVSHVPTSFRDPYRTWQTNVIGTLNILEAIRKHSNDSFFLFVSSSEVYGDSFKEKRLLTEGARVAPMNPYAASKCAAELTVREYFRQGISGVIVRPFNHIGPGQSSEFVTASFAKQIAEIEAGKQAPILRVGNLEAQRDFLDVRDVCSAYMILLELSSTVFESRVFNIASGKPRRISDLLTLLLQQSSLAVSVEEDSKLMRPSDIALAGGSCQLFYKETGWQPQYDIDSTLGDLLAYWREKV